MGCDVSFRRRIPRAWGWGCDHRWTWPDRGENPACVGMGVQPHHPRHLRHREPRVRGDGGGRMLVLGLCLPWATEAQDDPWSELYTGCASVDFRVHGLLGWEDAWRFGLHKSDVETVVRSGVPAFGGPADHSTSESMFFRLCWRSRFKSRDPPIRQMWPLASSARDVGQPRHHPAAQARQSSPSKSGGRSIEMTSRVAVLGAVPLVIETPPPAPPTPLPSPADAETRSASPSLPSSAAPR